MLSNQLSVEIVNKNIPGKCIDLDWNDTKLRRLTGGQEVVILHRILRGIAPRCGGKNWIFIGSFLDLFISFSPIFAKIDTNA